MEISPRMKKIAFVTDLHLGPRAYFEGKLRKLSHEAPALLQAVVSKIREEEHPDFLVNLGDDIEDESPTQDRERYLEGQQILRSAECPLLNVAGNHDTIHLSSKDLCEIWGQPGPLYYAKDFDELRVFVLHTVEQRKVDIRIDPAQLDWLREGLARDRRDAIVLMHHSASEQDLSDSRWFHRVPHLALVQERKSLQKILRESGVVRAVFNGHVHRNHLDVIDGIPYITVQSLIENLDEDAPGRPASAYAIALLNERRLIVRVRGNDPARYQIERSS